MFRRLFTSLALALVLLLVTTAIVAAANPKFIANKTSASINPNTGALVVVYQASGWGSGASVHVQLSANGELTLGCINRGENEPQGLRTFTGVVEAEQTVQAARTGTVKGTISAIPAGAESFSCPSRNMREVLISATYTNIELTATDVNDPSLTASIQLPDVSFP